MILVQRALGEGRGVLGGHEEECPVRLGRKKARGHRKTFRKAA